MDKGFTVTEEGKARIYLFENQRYPSVTTVIQSVLPFWEGSNQEEAYAKAMLGTEVHSMCAELTLNRRFAAKRIADFHPKIRGYGYSWLKFMEQTEAEVISQERAIFSRKLRVAGRPDAIMMINGKRTVADYTIGATRLAKRLQTSAYAMIWKEEFKDRHKYHRIEIPLKENGNLPTLRVHDNDNDKSAFISAVNFYRWKEAA
ncbi:MAG: PD-(D/E)XK nuclease family protein [Gammaproteobacteria bacterium]|nr:PD-(D/E)XK nuclease family protein [Gammaproteobacteria bacterium]